MTTSHPAQLYFPYTPLQIRDNKIFLQRKLLARHNRFIDADFVVRRHRKSVSHDASLILQIISTRIER